MKHLKHISTKIILLPQSSEGNCSSFKQAKKYETTSETLTKNKIKKKKSSDRQHPK